MHLSPVFYTLVMSCHVTLPRRFVAAVAAIIFGTIQVEYRGRWYAGRGVHLERQRRAAEVS